MFDDAGVCPQLPFDMSGIMPRGTFDARGMFCKRACPRRGAGVRERDFALPAICREYVALSCCRSRGGAAATARTWFGVSVTPMLLRVVLVVQSNRVKADHLVA